MSSEVAEELTICLADNPKHALFVEVGMVRAQKVVLGPIDGGSA